MRCSERGTAASIARARRSSQDGQTLRASNASNAVSGHDAGRRRTARGSSAIAPETPAGHRVRQPTWEFVECAMRYYTGRVGSNSLLGTPAGSTVGQHPSWARNQRVSMVPPEVYWLRYTWVKSACYGILGRASTMYIHAREKAATPVGAGRMACHKSLGWWTRNSENQQRAMRNVGYLIISKRYVDESPRADDNPPSPGQGNVVWQYDSLLRLAMPRHATKSTRQYRTFIPYWRVFESSLTVLSQSGATAITN